ncbi:MAG: hypothetical protein ACXVA9_01190 [Bdellovibrionales bacterium]
MKKLSLVLLSVFMVACSDHAMDPPSHDEIGAAVAAVSIRGNDTTKAGPTTAVSGGPNTLGVTGPTAENAAARIANGFEGNAPVTRGNLRQVLANVKTNLPKVTNVTSAGGYDQVQLLAYAACADIVQDGLMQNMFNVNPNATIAANQGALVAAGLRILDNHTAALASQGPNAAQVTTVFTTLVQTEAADATNTSKMAFMAVCIAASTAGSTLLGM